MPKYTKDYYKILNLKISATIDDIEDARRKLLMQSSTDIDLIKEAHKVLSNENSRKKYDKWYKKNILKIEKEPGMRWFDHYEQTILTRPILALIGLIIMIVSFTKQYIELGLLISFILFFVCTAVVNIFLYKKINNLSKENYRYIYISLFKGPIVLFMYIFLFGYPAIYPILIMYYLIFYTIPYIIWLIPNYIYFKKREIYLFGVNKEK